MGLLSDASAFGMLAHVRMGMFLPARTSSQSEKARESSNWLGKRTEGDLKRFGIVFDYVQGSLHKAISDAALQK